MWAAISPNCLPSAIKSRTCRSSAVSSGAGGGMPAACTGSLPARTGPPARSGEAGAGGRRASPMTVPHGLVPVSPVQTGLSTGVASRAVNRSYLSPVRVSFQ